VEEEILKIMTDEQLFKNRHSLSHLMTMAILEIYPDARLGVGPVIDNGFYQDYDLPEAISEEIFPKLEKRMKEMIKENIEFKQHDTSFEDATKEYKDDPYKTELIEGLKEAGEQSVSFYKSGSFENLCKGPHVDSTKEIDQRSFKLMKVAGAYWRGDEKNKMLTRIYGVAFSGKDALKAHLKMLEEAKKRDHRKLGVELDLFTSSPLVGAGLPLFTPRGTVVREQLTNFVQKLMVPHGYQRVHIPHLAKTDLYKTSGHWDKFADDIFHVSSNTSEDEFVLKPMNCPHHTQIYAAKMRSYRDLPLRFSEATAVYRDENSGQLQGLTRVRSITQDDAHVFCTPDQVKEEALKIYDIITKFYSAFDMALSVRLSIHDSEKMDKYLGGPEVWDKAVGQFEELLKELNQEYQTDVGEAAFYGPKIDFVATDAIGREWQLATIQLDFNLPERFELEYTDADNEKKRPVMLHRAILGSVERFMGVLIEHYIGAFPFWLSPEQVRFVSVGEDFNEKTKEFAQELLEAGIRVGVDVSDEGVGKKIRNSAMMKTPWTIVIGAKEVDGGDFKVNVFGQDEDLEFAQKDLVEKAKVEAEFPVK
jgi:threonyl-tRNA synthetase